jgi:hypothetical protein
MKKLAARDFEDLLQCSIPVFEGLLPEPYNSNLLTLLFRLNEWHSFAKLRMHSESTVQHLDDLTSEIGRLMRKFRDDTSTYQTFELPREVEARKRKKMKAAETQGKSTAPAAPGSSTRKRRTLNLSTYKWHALGDYVRTIKLFGPTISYSTQIVSRLSCAYTLISCQGW